MLVVEIWSSIVLLNEHTLSNSYRYEGSDDPGMGMTYVDIPTGYFVSNMAELNKDVRIQRVELEGRTLNMYFNSV
jgi:hypothetical protein